MLGIATSTEKSVMFTSLTRIQHLARHYRPCSQALNRCLRKVLAWIKPTYVTTFQPLKKDPQIPVMSGIREDASRLENDERDRLMEILPWVSASPSSSRGRL